MLRRITAALVAGLLLLAPACGDDTATDNGEVPEAENEGPVGEGGNEEEQPKVHPEGGGTQEEDENAPTGDPTY